MNQIVSSMFGMLSSEERQYLQDYAAKEYTAQGAIVDLGCWLGVSTVALAIGLAENPRLAEKTPVIHAYDCFIWESWMDLFVAGTLLEGQYQPGESFYKACQEQIAPWQDCIRLYQADLTQTTWQQGAIELLFIDAMKSWDLLNSITQQFFPSLIPGHSIVIQQDFSHFGTYWIHLLMYRFREYFQPVYDIPNSWSLAFRNIAPIPPEMLCQPLSLASFDRADIDAAFVYSQQIVSRSKQAQILGAKTITLLELGEIVQAQQELTQACAAGFSTADLDLPLSLAFPSLILSYLAGQIKLPSATHTPTTVVVSSAHTPQLTESVNSTPQPSHLPASSLSTQTSPSAATETLTYTGERHMAGQVGIDLTLSHIDHMVRYAFAAQFVTGLRVLDITCGSGYGSQFMAIQGAREVIGVDIDADAIDYACKYHQHPLVSYRVGDAHALPELETAFFDVIVSFETLEHLQRPREFLAELRRLLKPGGQLFLSCPNDYRISPWISEFHLHKFRFSEFRDLIVNFFEPVTFMGQYYGATSSLLRPMAFPDTFSQFSAYRQPLSGDFFGQQYLDAIPSLDDAMGYLAIVGVESSRICNQMSISLKAFQSLMELIYYDEQSIKNYLQQIQQLQAESENYRQQILQLQSEVGNYQHQVLQLQAESENYRQQILQLQSEVGNYQHQVLQLQAESEGYLHQTLQLQSQLGTYQHQVLQLQAESDSYQQQILQLPSEPGQLQGTIAAKEKNWFFSGYRASKKAMKRLIGRA